MTTDSQRTAVFAAAWLISSCSISQARDELRVDEVTPNESVEGTQVEVEIVGRGFRPAIARNVSCSADGLVPDDTFIASLSRGGHASTDLEEVVWVGEALLEAKVPGTLPVGSYALSVRDPFGRLVWLDPAFSVVAADDPDGGTDTDTDTDTNTDTDADAGPDTDTAECIDDIDCDDGDDCTDDACGGGICFWADNAGPCDDGLFCTAVDVCQGGDCVGDGDACPGEICDEGLGGCQEFIQVSDPLGDSSRFAFVFSHDGRIWVGPRADGTGAVSMLPNATDLQPVSFSFARDSSGNPHRNSSAAPYPSIGGTGCVVNTPECGPDNENGRGIFTSGTMSGDEWLMIAGARLAGDLDYVYLSDDDDDVLDFRFFDLSDVLGGATEGVSSAHVFSDRLYVGLPDTGGSRPYFIAIFSPPGDPGLDAIGNGSGNGGDCDPLLHDVCNLGGADFPGIGGSSNPSSIESIWDFNGRLYVANNGGVVRSTTEHPLNYGQAPGDWFEATPAASSWGAFVSYETAKTADLEPADKAVPGIVDFGGRLFLARNTTLGPQLWSCAPDHDGTAMPPATAADCDPGDWQLVAPDGVGPLELTRFDNASNGSLSLLAASSSYLYVGYDNAVDGVVVFRLADPFALTASSFEGLGGCSATDHPLGCEGLGGSGFGGSSNQRIFSHALLTQDGKDYLYLIVGNGAGAVSLYVLGS